VASERLIVFNDTEVQANEGAPPSWKLIAGKPIVRSWRKFEDPAAKRISGIWESTPGKFAVDYKVWEFCHFLEGVCILTEEGKSPKRLKAGDAFVLSPGFKGEWEIVETVRKHFVIQS
jgi:uncharacterized cupin superfamily protein